MKKSVFLGLCLLQALIGVGSCKNPTPSTGAPVGQAEPSASPSSEGEPSGEKSAGEEEKEVSALQAKGNTGGEGNPDQPGGVGGMQQEGPKEAPKEDIKKVEAPTKNLDPAFRAQKDKLVRLAAFRVAYVFYRLRIQFGYAQVPKDFKSDTYGPGLGTLFAGLIDASQFQPFKGSLCPDKGQSLSFDETQSKKMMPQSWGEFKKIFSIFSKTDFAESFLGKSKSSPTLSEADCIGALRDFQTRFWNFWEGETHPAYFSEALAKLESSPADVSKKQTLEKTQAALLALKTPIQAFLDAYLKTSDNLSDLEATSEALGIAAEAVIQAGGGRQIYLPKKLQEQK